MIGIEMVKDKGTREPLDKDSVVKIIMGMLNRGLVMVPCGRFGNVFRFMPPLVLTKNQAQKACEILLETVKAVESGKG
jgi:4-aminobutyrate aminotransferase